MQDFSYSFVSSPFWATHRVLSQESHKGFFEIEEFIFFTYEVSYFSVLCFNPATSKS